MSPLRRAVALGRATHPLPAAAVTALVSAAAAALGARGATLALVIGSTGVGQASVGWSNDYLDRHSDAAAGRSEKPIVAGDLAPETLWLAALAAFPASVLLSVPLGIPEAAVMLIAVGSAWAYNLGLKATAASWAPYVLSFGLAPVYAWLAAGLGLPPGWTVAATALLGLAGHLMNVMPDLEADPPHAGRGLPHRLGLRGSLLVACGTLAAVLALVLAATGPGAGAARAAVASIAGVLIVAVAVAGWRGRGRLGFRLTIAAVAAIVALFLLSPPVAP